jgi:hypothetical protein
VNLDESKALGAPFFRILATLKAVEEKQNVLLLVKIVFTITLIAEDHFLGATLFETNSVTRTLTVLALR